MRGPVLAGATLLASVLVAGSGLIAQDRASVALRAAIETETIQGDLASAIGQYKTLAQSGDRAIAAQALLRLAGCYERQADPLAAATYARILTEFADQPAVAAEARVRLAAVQAIGLTERRIWAGAGEGVSPDGSYITFIDSQTRDLAVVEVATGREQRITSGGKPGGPAAASGIPSPDGRQIAYVWTDGQAREQSIRVIDRRGGQPRVVHRNTESSTGTWPLAWSPDSRSIMVTIDRLPANGERSRDLAWISVTDGSVRVIKSFPGFTGFQQNAGLSPDGRYVAYNIRPAADKQERDIAVLALATGQETTIVRNAADDNMLAWFPTGDRILFASDRQGSIGIWSIDIVNGGASGEPRLVRENTVLPLSLGFTSNGDFYYSVQTLDAEVYVATPAQASSAVAPLAPLPSRFVGLKSQAVWSPSGDRIAFVQHPAPWLPRPERRQRLAILTLSTGQTDLIPASLQAVGLPAWLPDGQTLVVQGRSAEGSVGLFSVDVATGAVRELGEAATAATERRTFAAPSADGHLFYRWAPPPGASGQSGFGVRNLATGAERRLPIASASSLALSPDGRWLATVAFPSPVEGRISIWPVAGGEARSIGETHDWRQAITWSADGQSLFAVKETGDESEVWQLPITGGPPRPTGIVVTGRISGISAHPDGRRLAISTSRVMLETRVLQNFPK